jgi:hypothetical protein
VRADGRAAVAPLGLRRVESALLSRTPLTAGDVAVVTPETLPDALGPWAKVVGVCSSDPLGGGMSNTTTSNFCRGELYTHLWTDELMRRVARAKSRFGFRVVAGGAGAWQWARRPGEARRQGIDVIFEGPFEDGGPELMMDLLDGRAAPPHVRRTGSAEPEPIAAPSMLGIVELSRGCGKGCRFCAAGRTKMQHLPADTILADVQTNVAGGFRCCVNGSEDFFRYGARDGRVDFPALHDLLEQMARIPGLWQVQADHANISSVAQLTDEQLRETRRLLCPRGRTDYLWMNLGVESANGRLVAANGPGKIDPFRPDDWEELVRDAAERLNRAGFFPVLSIVLGLPGETPDDVARTRKLVADLSAGRAAVFPVFHEPIRTGAGEPFTVGRMRADHLDLFTACYELNFRWIPRLYWDNQRAGGVALWRRLLTQALGRLEVVAWRRRFAAVGRQLDRRGAARTAEAPTRAELTRA